MTVAHKTRFASVLLIVFLLVGCETTGTGGGVGTKTAVGGLGGAAAGGLLAAAVGGSPVGIAAGTIIGGLVGGAIGNRMDAADKRHANEAAARAMESAPSGQSVAWQNPDNGNSGTVTPTRTYQTAGGQYCREYQQTVTIGGEQHEAFGTACRQPDGSWRTMN